MKASLKEVIFLLIITSFSHGVSSQKGTTVFSQKIVAVYYQRWTSGSVETGTYFSIQFEKPLSSNIQLQKVYFQNQEASFKLKPKNTYVAYFYHRNSKQDYIMDSDSIKEYGNTPPVVSRPKFNLKPNEAVLLYLKNGKTYYFKITNAKELPMIVYPAMNKRKI
jgi:hypothetical protein